MDKMYYCNLCEKSFFDASKLKYHDEVVQQKTKIVFVIHVRKVSLKQDT